MTASLYHTAPQSSWIRAICRANSTSTQVPASAAWLVPFAVLIINLVSCWLITSQSAMFNNTRYPPFLSTKLFNCTLFASVSLHHLSICLSEILRGGPMSEPPHPTKAVDSESDYLSSTCLSHRFIWLCLWSNISPEIPLGSSDANTWFSQGLWDAADCVGVLFQQAVESDDLAGSGSVATLLHKCCLLLSLHVVNCASHKALSWPPSAWFLAGETSALKQITDIAKTLRQFFFGLLLQSNEVDKAFGEKTTSSEEIAKQSLWRKEYKLRRDSKTGGMDSEL